ncbi:armadillo/beta-catenin/plakoglobin [Wallemia mellicola CBS 633.66]|uniref:uridine/cytidine kinase n=1 Tax=Wallemia mellicola (strain ATCC MYA-4683 / CBS 633.66) TaxID=671144 RepID=I4YJ28_WALMC|nr:armadillo/beta-catenin/plakoglobin [Wallemia mellicola CBS 633.66]EIM23970.1 armadillo/beta-catenin/plakoglobin [Wallemia mellicola CBS 633.66]|eukprot:XP_006955806.1 armadillo/beta-catenin/plakoglobin [Wallemia mellicola CBS 633.66]
MLELLNQQQKLKNQFIKTDGVRAWYDMSGSPVEPFIIGIGGGTASGKTFVAHEIVKRLKNVQSIAIISQDSFYGERTPEEIELAHKNMYDFDSPQAIDMSLFTSVLHDIKKCRAVQLPNYSFVTHSRLPQSTYLYGARVVIVEGILVLTDPALRDLFDMKVFVQCDSDVMLARRIKRDVVERGRDVDGVLNQFLKWVKPSFENFVLPSSRHADIIVPGAANSVAVDLIVTHLKQQLTQRSRFLRKALSTASPSCSDLPPNVKIIEQTATRNALLTILRDLGTSRTRFVETVDRLAAHIAQEVFTFLPHRSRTVTTPVSAEYEGKKLDTDNLCAVSIQRSGSLFNHGLRRIFPAVALGSVLIQHDDASGEPALYHHSLPQSVKDPKTSSQTWVLITDAQIGTGAAAFMAIRVLLDHGVQEKHIIFLSFLVARRGGVHAINSAFPDIKILTAAADPLLREVEVPISHGDSAQVPHHQGEKVDGRRTSVISLEQPARKKYWQIVPGMGNVGDRYYGTN